MLEELILIQIFDRIVMLLSDLLRSFTCIFTFRSKWFVRLGSSIRIGGCGHFFNLKWIFLEALLGYEILLIKLIVFLYLSGRRAILGFAPVLHSLLDRTLINHLGIFLVHEPLKYLIILVLSGLLVN